ncbi:MAG: cytochrome b/b6 domain-containing protein [Beijerinckiaceae bacterium]
MTFLNAFGSAADDPAESSALIDYRFAAKALHWLTAGLVFLMIACGLVMTQLGEGPVADFLFGAHKMTGVFILGLVIVRWLNRLVMRLRGRWIAQTGHRRIHSVLYGVIMVVPLLGWAGVSDFGARGVLFGWELPAIWPEGAGYSDGLLLAHAWLAFGLLLLVALHIGLALEDYIMRNGAADLAPEASSASS